MGALLSRLRDSELRDAASEPWSWSGPAGDHSPYPQDVVKYPGPELLYCFVDILTSYQIMRNLINLGPQVVTTNVDAFEEEFIACYNEQFTLNNFVKIPGLKATTKVQDWAEKAPYQAIFCKPTAITPTNTEEKWKLLMEKRILSTKTLSSTEDGEESDLIQIIHRHAEKGIRLACARPVGYVRYSSDNDQYAMMGVDMFFNVPEHKLPTIYAYHAIRVQMCYYVVPDVSQQVQQVECDTDWMGQLRNFLAVGWKLVDICIDTTALADAFGMRSGRKIIDAIWVFEKEKRELTETKPLYEGVIIEYKHKVKSALEGEAPCRDWRPVIAGMGVTGWELATIVQTPVLVQSSFTVYCMKLLMFFQRPLIASHQQQVKVVRDREEASRVQQAKRQKLLFGEKDPKKHRFGRKKKTPAKAELRQPPTAPQVGNQPNLYYNHTLGRYVVGEPGDGNLPGEEPLVVRGLNQPGSRISGPPRQVSGISGPSHEVPVVGGPHQDVHGMGSPRPAVRGTGSPRQEVRMVGSPRQEIRRVGNPGPEVHEMGGLRIGSPGMGAPRREVHWEGSSPDEGPRIHGLSQVIPQPAGPGRAVHQMDGPSREVHQVGGQRGELPGMSSPRQEVRRGADPSRQLPRAPQRPLPLIPGQMPVVEGPIRPGPMPMDLANGFIPGMLQQDLNMMAMQQQQRQQQQQQQQQRQPLQPPDWPNRRGMR